MRNKSVVTPDILWCVILCNYDDDTKSMKPNSKNLLSSLFKLGLNSLMKFSIPSKYQCCNLIMGKYVAIKNFQTAICKFKIDI